MAKRYRVTLTQQEREEIQQMIRKGKSAASKLAHARVLLLAHARVLLLADESADAPARADQQIAQGLNLGTRAVERVRQRFVEQGLEAALAPAKSKRIYTRKLDGKQEAKPHRAGLLQAAGRQETPGAAIAGGRGGGAGDRRLALARDGAADAEKNELKPHRRKMWCIPPKRSGAFVYHTEGVLEVYHRPYDQRRVRWSAWTRRSSS